MGITLSNEMRFAPVNTRWKATDVLHDSGLKKLNFASAQKMMVKSLVGGAPMGTHGGAICPAQMTCDAPCE
jgi:hypothetical protein